MTRWIFIRVAIGCLLAFLMPGYSRAALEGFETQGVFSEQVRAFTFDPGVHVRIVAPPTADPALPVSIILYALPNGNTTDQTIGRARKEGLDWHFDIQHIGAQTRVLREAMTDRNVVVVYLEAEGRSWPTWRKNQAEPGPIILALVEEIRRPFAGMKQTVTLTGHSGGGSFTTGFLNAVEAIPEWVDRIAWLDSNYSYSDEERHGDKVLAWLAGDPARQVVAMAYDDRNVELNGKKIVSDTGGTYRATHRLIDRIRKDRELPETTLGDYEHFRAPGIEILIHRNPELKILHTALVGDRNGFIHAMTVGTKHEGKLASIDGPRAYGQFIEDIPTEGEAAGEKPIPARAADAPTGSAFIASIQGLSKEEREAAVLAQLTAGNVPEFLRRTVPVTVVATTLDGTRRVATFEAMPDYLSIGSDADFVRMPMNPYTAQAFCDAFGYTLPTVKMVDDIWTSATLHLEPQPMTERREEPATYLENHRLIEEQRGAAPLGQLIAGTKKDVVISNRLREKPHRVAIYGWHYKTGKPIQPLTIVHVDWYVDYSHGIRPIRRMVEVDGRKLPLADALADPNLADLFSGEGPIATPRYVGPVQPPK